MITRLYLAGFVLCLIFFAPMVLPMDGDDRTPAQMHICTLLVILLALMWPLFSIALIIGAMLEED